MGSDPRRLALIVFVSLLIAMLSFALLAGRPNQGLLSMSLVGRQIFAISASAGVLLSFYLLRISASRLAGVSGKGLRQSLASVSLAFAWALACFLCLQRFALLLGGPVSVEPGHLHRPLTPGPPLWCSQFTAVHTNAGDFGSLCMERLTGRSSLMPLLGCVPLDSPATLQITRTFLGPVGSLLEVVDVDGRCAKRGSKQ